MKGLLLVIGLRKTGYDTTPMERMVISPQLDAEIENLNPPLTIEELSQLLYAAKMEFGKISRLRAKTHLTLRPADEATAAPIVKVEPEEVVAKRVALKGLRR